MIKSMFKRTWLSITRKPSKTLIIGIVFFVMANLVLATISIKNAVNESTEFAKNTLGSTVYLTADMDKVREEAMPNTSQDGNGTFTRIRIERPEIKLDMVTTIADSEYVKDFTYGINANAKEGNFTALENNMSSGPSFSMGGAGITNLYGNMTIIGINSYAFINEVQSKTMELIDGTYFDENTKDKAIISNELASENDLKVGDKITLINEEIDLENYDPRSSSEPKVTSSNTYEVEIIGIYDVNTDNFNGNTIYMNVETASQFLKVDNYNEGNYSVDNVSYFLVSPDDIDKFIEEANDKYPDLSEQKLKLDINSEAYDTMAGPIEQVGSFANTILWIVIIASILIITLIINNNIKERKYEIGVLMSLGSTRTNIIGQILCELLITGTFAFLLSIGTSYFLADTMAQNLLKNQIELSEQQSENNYGRPGAGPGGGFTISGGQISRNDAQNVEIIKDIDISVSVINYILLFTIGYVIIIISMIIPSANIIKYEPKTILTGRE